MARTFIRSRDAQASITLDGVEYNDVFDTANLAPNAPELSTTVFSTQNTGGESELGVQRFIMDFSGPLAKGSASSVPIIDLEAFQNVAFELEFDTGCGISGTASAREHPGITDGAGGNKRSNARFVTQGSYIISWDEVGS